MGGGLVVSQGLQLARIRHIIAGFVLGQDLHERPQFQPPLLLGDPVPGRKIGQLSNITFVLKTAPNYYRLLGAVWKASPKKMSLALWCSNLNKFGMIWQLFLISKQGLTYYVAQGGLKLVILQFVNQILRWKVLHHTQYMCVCVYVCVSVHACLSLRVCLYMYLCVYMHVHYWRLNVVSYTASTIALYSVFQSKVSPCLIWPSI